MGENDSGIENHVYKDLFNLTNNFNAWNITHLLIMVMIWALMKFNNLTFFFILLYIQSMLYTSYMPYHSLLKRVIFTKPWDLEQRTPNFLIITFPYCVFHNM